MTTKHTKLNAARRNFLRVSAAGAGVMALGALGSNRLPFAKPARALPLSNHRRLVIINMLGGNDGLNTVFPVTGAQATAYQTLRPTLRFMPGQGLALTGGPNVSDYELHPALDTVQSMWNANEVAIIHKVGYPSENLSHFVSEDIWSWGVRGGLPALSGIAPGWIARYANTYAPTSLGVVSIGVGRRLDFEGANSSPLLVSSLGSFNFDTDFNYSANHVLRRTKVQNVLNLQPAGGLAEQVAAAQLGSIDGAAAVQTAIADYTAYASGAGIAYPTNPGSTSLTSMGSRLRDIARLIYGGFETRIFYTGYGGFDTHAAQAAAHASLLQNLDDALAVFKTDMQTMGVWNDMAIVVITEFGRRNYENGSVGTDHGHGVCVFVIGGSSGSGGHVNGGMYEGLTTANINAEHLPYSVDYRDVYRELIGGHLGNDPTPLFPETQPINNIPNFIS
ncbi:MAG: DUF1501 domain-containing protein [Planctomycetes bacterium]|jgi:uncharacterized protein (DUF1501 family)|nr:DUF1501 domain-containing protein [Planctomycetota bacterium]